MGHTVSSDVVLQAHTRSALHRFARPSRYLCGTSRVLAERWRRARRREYRAHGGHPPPGVASALQLIFRSERSKPAQPEERRYFQELWNHVREWIDRDSARTVVLAVMSAWAAQRACRETLGAAFVVQQLRECLAVHTSVYGVDQLLVALTEMSGGQPDVADDVLAYAIDLRDAGLLLNCPPRSALALVAALESQLGTARVGQLRNVLTADKVIGPLAPDDIAMRRCALVVCLDQLSPRGGAAHAVSAGQRVSGTTHSTQGCLYGRVTHVRTVNGCER